MTDAPITDAEMVGIPVWLEACEENDDYGDGDYGRNITAGDLVFLADAPFLIRGMLARIEAMQPLCDAAHGWAVTSTRRKAENKLMEAFDTYLEAMRGTRD